MTRNSFLGGKVLYCLRGTLSQELELLLDVNDGSGDFEDYLFERIRTWIDALLIFRFRLRNFYFSFPLKSKPQCNYLSASLIEIWNRLLSPDRSHCGHTNVSLKLWVRPWERNANRKRTSEIRKYNTTEQNRIQLF